jgi:hypothetical protein
MSLSWSLAAAIMLLLLPVVVQQIEAWQHHHHYYSTAFAPPTPFSTTNSIQKRSRRSNNNANVVVLSAGGGFGGGASAGDANKEKKLKPKQQWDRYVELKKAAKVQVAARVANKDEASSSSEWLLVGSVKSKDNAYTKIAVVRQRALIAEVSGYNVAVLFSITLPWERRFN